MGFMDLIRKSSRPAHKLTEEDREKAAEVNRARFELQRYKIEREKSILELEQRKRELQLERDMAKLQSEISEYSDDDDENPADNADGMITGLLTSVLANRQVSPPAGGVSQVSPLSNPPALHLDDNQIYQLWAEVPKPARKIAKTMSDEQLKAIMLNKVGNIDEDTLARALNIIKST